MNTIFIVTLVLKCSLYFVLQADDGETLHLAARKNDTHTIQRLTGAGMDVNIRDTVSIRLLIRYRWR